MTKCDIDAIRQRCEKATPGPWAISLDLRLVQDKPHQAGQNLFKIMNNLRFIVNARTDIPALLDRIEKLEAVAEAAKTITQRIKCEIDSENIDNDMAGICPSEWSCSKCPWLEMVKALEDLDGDNNGKS